MNKLSILENSLFGISFKKLPTLIPGIILTGSIAWISIVLSKFIGTELLGFSKSPVSSVMIAILLGMLISNLIHLPAILTSGVTFSVKKLLRLGIILLGIRLSIAEVFSLGIAGIPIVITCIIGAVVLTILFSGWMKLPEKIGVLIGVGTSICGVSAIIAAGPVIEAKEEETAYAVSVITIFGMLATLLYPYLAFIIFSGDPLKAGLFLGTSIHDTAQATGAGLVYSELFDSPGTLNAAVVTKLVRNIFMIFAIPLLALYNSGKGMNQLNSENEIIKKEKIPMRIHLVKLIPVFIMGFLLFALIRSAGDMTILSKGKAFGFISEETWKLTHNTLKPWAGNLLATALAGVGLKTRISQLKSLGIKPFLVGLLAALIVGLISYGMITLLSNYISI